MELRVYMQNNNVSNSTGSYKRYTTGNWFAEVIETEDTKIQRCYRLLDCWSEQDSVFELLSQEEELQSFPQQLLEQRPQNLPWVAQTEMKECLGSLILLRIPVSDSSVALESLQDFFSKTILQKIVEKTKKSMTTSLQVDHQLAEEAYQIVPEVDYSTRHLKDTGLFSNEKQDNPKQNYSLEARKAPKMKKPLLQEKVAVQQSSRVKASYPSNVNSHNRKKRFDMCLIDS
jgi:hypothetical protein